MDVLAPTKKSVAALTIDAFTNLAFDRASCRAFDDDGHMHVTQTPISKATVNPYNGSEIPDWQELGLDPDKVYHLLRDPEELEKAAASFNGKPLLFTHKPVTSVDHDFEGTVGSVFNAKYEHPYLKADLAVHPAHAIEAIKSNEQKELSSAYRYRADMTPGKYEGEPFDGVMRDIKGNHVALVKEGRAGPDVVVGDELPATLRGLSMNRTAALSRTAIAGPIALAALLKSKMAKDAKIDWSPLFKGVTAKNFGGKKPAMATDIKRQLSGKLAKDANLDDVVELLDKLEEVIPQEGPDVEFKKIDDLPGKDDDDETALDEDDAAKREKLKAAGFTDEQIGAICAIFGAPAEAVDSAEIGYKDGNPDVATSSPADKATEPAYASGTKSLVGDKRAMDAKIREATKGMVSKTAMDQAIAAAEKRASAAAIQTQRDIFEALTAVKPWVGELSVAMDSAEDVYRTALATLGRKDADKLHADALRPVLEAQPKPGDYRRAPLSLVTQDSASNDEYLKMFPNAGRLKN